MYHLVSASAGNHWFGRRIDSAEQIEFPSSSSCRASSKDGASSVCLLVTKLVLIALYYTLYYKFKQFTNIFIDIFT